MGTLEGWRVDGSHPSGGPRTLKEQRPPAYRSQFLNPRCGDRKIHAHQVPELEIHSPRWGWELSWSQRRRLRPELERQCFRIWLLPRSGGQRGSFPGALARGRPQAGHCSQSPIPEASWSLGCSLQTGPLPHQHSLPTVSPLPRTPKG